MPGGGSTMSVCGYVEASLGSAVKINRDGPNKVRRLGSTVVFVAWLMDGEKDFDAKLNN